jgi:hypothetical protein
MEAPPKSNGARDNLAANAAQSLTYSRPGRGYLP